MRVAIIISCIVVVVFSFVGTWWFFSSKDVEKKQVVLHSELTPLSVIPSRSNSPVPLTISPTPRDPVEAVMALTPLERHKKLHYPIIGKQILQPTPFLTIPLKKSDVASDAANFIIGEGFIYSEDERKLHGMSIHNGFDINAPYGSAVYSPVNGYAVSTYESFMRKDKDGNIRKVNGEPLHVGYGYYVQLYVPEVNRFVIVAHLSDVSSGIPFVQPKKNPKVDIGGWVTPFKDYTVQDFTKDTRIVQVHRGDYLGSVGYSGLLIGKEEYIADSQRPVVIDATVMKSWDEPHIHMEEFGIDNKTKVLGWRRDPFALYDTYERYPKLLEKAQLGKDTLFLLEDDGTLKFAL